MDLLRRLIEYFEELRDRLARCSKTRASIYDWIVYAFCTTGTFVIAVLSGLAGMIIAGSVWANNNSFSPEQVKSYDLPICIIVISFVLGIVALGFHLFFHHDR